MRFATNNLFCEPTPRHGRQQFGAGGGDNGGGVVPPGSAAVETEDGNVLETEDGQAIKLE